MTTPSPETPDVVLPKDLAANPRLSTWVDLGTDGVVTVRVGKVELGQGILTALAQIAAEELDVDVERVVMQATSTAGSPDEALTAGSLSIMFSGAALRQACAEARAVLCAAAAAELGVDLADLTVGDGDLRGPGGGHTTYWRLDHATLLDRDADGRATPKKSTDYRLVGASVQRLDLPDKVTGRPRFVHDLRLSGQLYGRVIRPPSRQAHIDAIDDEVVAGLPDAVTVVRDGDFLGVIADREAAAVAAASTVADAVTWHESASLPDEDDLPGFLRSAKTERTVIAEPTGDARADDVAHRLTRSYGRPYLAHASLAPSCGIARWRDGGVTVWTHSQGVFQLRRAIHAQLGVPLDRVVVHHVEGAGSYGHNAADDAAFDAVLLARAAPGRPVQVVWSRHDELTWAPFGAAMTVDLEATVGVDGRLLSWRHEAWSNGHTSRPDTGGLPRLLAATHTADPTPIPPSADPPPERGAGLLRNAVPYYDVPHLEVVGNRLLTMPLRVSSLRSLGAHLNVFAVESFLDELAEAAGADPVEFRLRHLTDPRARAVVETVAAAADRSPRGDASGDTGRGIGFARYKNIGAYCAVVADVEATHEVRVTRLHVAVDVGQVVNPDGVANQLEGGAIQATSWTLKERVRFDDTRVTSGDWETYPILRFTEVPRVDVEIMSRPDDPPLGAGEAAQGPAAAAIGNAVYDALGVRARDLPLTPDRITALL